MAWYAVYYREDKMRGLLFSLGGERVAVYQQISTYDGCNIAFGRRVSSFCMSDVGSARSTNVEILVIVISLYYQHVCRAFLK